MRHSQGLKIDFVILRRAKPDEGSRSFARPEFTPNEVRSVGSLRMTVVGQGQGQDDGHFI